MLTSLILTATLIVSCAHLDKSGNQDYIGVNSFLPSQWNVAEPRHSGPQKCSEPRSSAVDLGSPAVRGLDLSLEHETWLASGETMSAVTQT